MGYRCQRLKQWKRRLTKIQRKISNLCWFRTDRWKPFWDGGLHMQGWTHKQQERRQAEKIRDSEKCDSTHWLFLNPISTKPRRPTKLQHKIFNIVPIQDRSGRRTLGGWMQRQQTCSCPGNGLRKLEKQPANQLNTLTITTLLIIMSWQSKPRRRLIKMWRHISFVPLQNESRKNIPRWTGPQGWMNKQRTISCPGSEDTLTKSERQPKMRLMQHTDFDGVSEHHQQTVKTNRRPTTIQLRSRCAILCQWRTNWGQKFHAINHDIASQLCSSHPMDCILFLPGVAIGAVAIALRQSSKPSSPSKVHQQSLLNLGLTEFKLCLSGLWTLVAGKTLLHLTIIYPLPYDSILCYG